MSACFDSIPLPSGPAAVSEWVLEVEGVTKPYGALRPLRLDRLRLADGDVLALSGFDQPAAEVLINLLTGAALPDSGSVKVFGQPTSAIADSDAWLASLDRFGMVSDRAAFLEPFTVVQNLAMPFTLDIEPPPGDVRDRAVALAREVQIPESAWDRPVHGLAPAHRLRLRLARALALGPSLLLLEHPSATLERDDVAPFGRDLRQIAQARRLATLVITMDKALAATLPKTVSIDPSNGRAKEGLLARLGFGS